MKTFFATHNKALKAEWLKLHHSGMLWFCIIAGAFIPAFNTFFSFFGSVGTPSPERGHEMIEADFQIFTGFLFPVFLVIVMVRLVYTEHKYDTWKLIETQPISKAALYFSKWEIAACISLFSLIVLLLVAYLGGWILQFGKPALGFDQSNIDWSSLFHSLTRYWIASLTIISVQYFFSVLIKGFALPMSIGLIAIFAGSLAVELGYMNWWPYSATHLTSETSGAQLNGKFLLSHEKISLLSSLLFIWLGYHLYNHKSFKKAFVSPLTNLTLTCVVVGVFTLAISAVNKPSTLPRYTTTVVSGSIETTSPVTHVFLLRTPMMDTILSIPVIKNRFHIRTDKEIAQGIYYIKAGSQAERLFMGSNDSINLDITFKEQRSTIKVTGTRVAENDYLENGKRTDMEVLRHHANNVSPEDFAADVIEYYHDGIRQLEAFKTSDRIKPAEDFIQLRKKLFAMQVLALTDGFYPSVFISYFPNQELTFPESVNSLRSTVSMSAPELISFPEYRRFVKSTLREKSDNNDSLYFSMLKDSLRDPYTRDVMLYEAVSESIPKMKDSNYRNGIVSNIVANMQTENVKTKLIEANIRSNMLQGGKPAYDFTAEALNSKEIKLSNFAGKYIVIEFRDTRCVPCKKESPYFEARADLYTSPKVAFLSLSLDADKKAWDTEAKLKKAKTVWQLLTKDDHDIISKAYSLKTIPRFILINPRGQIINAQLPYPSEPEFEMILQKEISQ